MGVQFWLAMALAGQMEPRVIAVLEGEEFASRGIVADLVERPAGVSDEAFARQLIDAEGLQPWDGHQLHFPPAEGAMGTMAVSTGDGREIIVKYVAGDARRSGRICRLRLSRGGMSDALWNAYRWCAAAFGLSLPEVPPSPIVTVVEPPRP